VVGALIQGTGTDGNFYGLTWRGAAAGAVPHGCGTLFKMTPSGTLTVVYSFLGQPTPGLIQGTDGVFYGETNSLVGGGDYGSIYSLSVGLGPFVETQPASGAVGTAVKILGTDLTGAPASPLTARRPSSPWCRVPKSRPPCPLAPPLAKSKW
jgi:uncharacterized repeat protein (TIGR03803 family)